MSNNEERLQKVIAHSGVTSRRKAEKLIEDGKVTVNGKKVKKLGTKVTPDDKVEVEGLPLEKEQHVYYVVYKPRGVISSLNDDKNRKVLTDLIPYLKERVYPVGRLDYDTSGIILLTNDGEFTQLLMHPSHEMDKVYVAKIEGIPSREAINELRKGVKSEGDVLKAIHAKILSTDEQKNTAIMEVVLHQGKNRQVRRMFEGIDHPVKKLKRERYGFLTLQGLQPGDYRELTPHEVKQLRNEALQTKIKE